MELSVRGSAHAVFRNAASGVLFYGVTPPRLGTEPERVREIARITLERLATVAVDGLIVYDVDAESDRSRENRPFPFLPMMDPAQFLTTPSTRGRNRWSCTGPSVSTPVPN